MRLVLAGLLILESLVTAMRVADLLAALPGHDAVAVALILARGLCGAIQFTGGWLLTTRRPAASVIAGWALILTAALTTLDVGLQLAPSSIYPWWRWQVVCGYWVYALVANWYLRTQRTR